FSGLLLCGAYVFLGIFGYTSLMDRQNFAFYIEFFRGIAGIALIWVTNDWFGINSIWEYGSLVIAVYFVLSILGGFYFTFVERAGMEQQIAL
ncbi:MAG: sterol desaturase, partial [Muriicola sp.]|nr:sterol desaturase [Muriicola sp.]NNK36368.1 sterol desaturase [Eudoraea sp.]